MASMYIPGFTNMLEQPEYQGGPARVTLPVAPAPGVRPSAPPIMQAPTVQPSAPPIMQAPAVDLGALAGLNINPVFIGTGLGGSPTQQLVDLGIDPATGLKLNKARTVELGPMGTIVREITPEGSMPGAYFSNDLGMPAITGLGKDAIFTPLDPNAVYTVVNERTGEVVSEGVGAEGLKAAQLASSQLSKAGRKADWAVVKTDPNTGAASTVANVDPRQSDLGKFADVVLPAALAFALPGAGLGISNALAAGLGAAGGSALSSVAQGRSLGETLKRAAISGGVAGLGSFAGGELGAALSKTAPTASGVGGSLGGALAAAGPAAQAALNATLPGIVVSGALGSAAGGALGSAAGSALGSTLAAPAAPTPAPAPTPAQQQPVEITPEGDLVLTGTRIPEVVNPLPFTTAGASGLAKPGLDAVKAALEQQAAQAQQQPVEEEPVGQIDVVATPEAAPDFVTGALSTIPNVALPTNVPQSILDIARAEAPQEGEIIVTPTAEPSVVPNLVAAATPNLVYGGPEGQLSEIIAEQPRLDPESAARTEAATAAAIANNVIPSGGEIPSGQTPTDGETTLETEDSLLDKLKKNLGVTDYMRLAALGVGLLGGGGGNRGALSTIPSGLFGGGSGVFGGRLPAATLPGVSTGFAPRTADDLGPKTTQDWYRYGYGPEQSFFSYVPKGEPNTSRAYTGYEQAQADEDKGFAVGGMAGGGMRGPGSASNSYAVNGPGTGRSDEIPALLSDGEYVIDAETVALLGDGSSKAGAERLDQLRVKIRKDKGRKLAKGEFSGNAKRPEHYLKGGRA